MSRVQFTRARYMGNDRNMRKELTDCQWAPIGRSNVALQILLRQRVSFADSGFREVDRFCFSGTADQSFLRKLVEHVEVIVLPGAAKFNTGDYPLDVANICGVPVPRSSRLSLPSAKNPIERLSGDQKGRPQHLRLRHKADRPSPNFSQEYPLHGIYRPPLPLYKDTQQKSETISDTGVIPGCTRELGVAPAPTERRKV